MRLKGNATADPVQVVRAISATYRWQRVLTIDGVAAVGPRPSDGIVAG